MFPLRTKLHFASLAQSVISAITGTILPAESSPLSVPSGPPATGGLNAPPWGRSPVSRAPEPDLPFGKTIGIRSDCLLPSPRLLSHTPHPKTALTPGQRERTFLGSPVHPAAHGESKCKREGSYFHLQPCSTQMPAAKVTGCRGSAF